MYQDTDVALQVLSSLLRVRTLVHQHTAKHDEDRMTHFLYAAARGDTELIQQVGNRLSQRGLSVSSPRCLTGASHGQVHSW